MSEKDRIALQQLREQLLHEHVDAENHYDVDRVIATFTHPRYEIVPTGAVFDGEPEVRRYYAESPRIGHSRYEVLRLHHGDDAVVVELRTHPTAGAAAGAPDLLSAAVFVFDGPDLVCERVYFDRAQFDVGFRAH